MGSRDKVSPGLQVPHSLTGSQLWQKPKRHEERPDWGLEGEDWKGWVEEKTKAGGESYLALVRLQVRWTCTFLMLRVMSFDDSGGWTIAPSFSGLFLKPPPKLTNNNWVKAETRYVMRLKPKSSAIGRRPVNYRLN